MLTGAPAFRFCLVIDLHEQRHINVVGFKAPAYWASLSSCSHWWTVTFMRPNQ
jgi:hypothetical protein